MNELPDEAQLLDDLEVNHWSRVFASRSRRIHKATNVSTGGQQLDAGLEGRAIEESCIHAAKFADAAVAELRKRTQLLPAAADLVSTMTAEAKGASKA